MEIHQVVVSASPADAVTNAALELRQLLRRIGRSEIFARYFDPLLTDDVLPLDAYPALDSARRGRNLLIYHASIGEPEVTDFLLQRTEPLVLVYHNMTPPALVAPYDPALARLLALGPLELSSLRQRVVLALAVSPYNARDLQRLGYQDVRVCPMPVDVAALAELDPDPPTWHHLQKRMEGPVILFVGQLLPHKRPDLLVQAYHVLVTYLLPDSNLILVGAGRDGRYRRALQQFVHELNLTKAWLTGAVAPAALAAFYRRADLFSTASEHEGLCHPLLESMGFGVPIVARDFAAVPETLDGAGLVVQGKDPVLLAETWALVLQDLELRRELVAQGRRRLADFDPEACRGAFLEHLASVA